MEQRLQKILSNYGVASRRKAEQMILERRVRVNGNTASLGDAADDEEDVIEVDGVRLKKQPARIVLMLNKPRGYVCTLSDEKGRKNVAELVSGCGARVYPVGRLDLNSEGLLLLTNNGELSRMLELPQNGWSRRYKVKVHGRVSQNKIDSLTGGVTIDGINYGPVKIVSGESQGTNSWLTITLQEGKNREIRRLMKHVGLEVARLIRLSYGPFQLGGLKKGEVREVPQKVLKEQLGEKFKL